MLLTILIPTRNRRRRVCALVSFLATRVQAEGDGAAELLVVDNASEDGTAEALGVFAREHVRIVSNVTYIPTSEENVFANYQQARGRFIWFLGDDDLPRPGAVGRLVALAREDAADLIVSNFRVVDEQGRLVTQAQVRGAPERTQLDVVDLAKRIGLVNAMSGWSVLMARKSMLDGQAATAWAELNPIYSHVFWLLECFKSRSTVFLGEPLVDYRIFHDRAGWLRTARSRNRAYLYHWHLGLLRHYKRAIEQKLMTRDDVAAIYEYRHNGTRYRALDEVVYKLIEQADVFVDTASKHNLLGPEDFKAAADILMELDITLQDLLWSVEDIYSNLWRAEGGEVDLDLHGRLRDEALDLVDARDRDLFSTLRRGAYGGYSIYAVADRWVAIRGDALALQDRVFARFELRSAPPLVLVEPTQADLQAAIDLAPPAEEVIGERPPLVSTFWLETSGPGQRLLRQAEDAANDGSGRTPPYHRLLWLGSAAALGHAAPEVRLDRNWSGLEPEGVWSLGEASSIWVRPPEGCTALRCEGWGYAPPGASRGFRLAVRSGEGASHELTFGQAHMFELAARGAGGRLVELRLSCDPAPTPAQSGESSDTRQLGFFLRSIWSIEAPSEAQERG